MRLWTLIVTMLWIPMAVGCPTTAADDDDAGDDDDATPYEQPAPWDELDHEQRLEFMRQVFEPEMKAVFQDFDASLFEDFKCETCHGSNMVEVDYAMPNGLIPLDSQGRPAEPSYNAQALGDYMSDEVVPLGQDLLEQPATGLNRWGCFACHDQR